VREREEREQKTGLVTTGINKHQSGKAAGYQKGGIACTAAAACLIGLGRSYALPRKALEKLHVDVERSALPNGALQCVEGIS